MHGLDAEVKSVTVDGFVSTREGELVSRSLSYEIAATGSEVLVEVSHCALGRGDVDFVDRRFTSQDSLVPGHEIVGLVIAAGPDVTRVSIGDRVGVGYQVTSCGSCGSCQTRLLQHCRSQQCLIVDRPGGLGVFVLTEEAFAVPIPSDLDSVTAAPLMSSGLTAYSAVMSSDVEAGMNVAVVGLGGMGHVATQLLQLAGCEVTAITSKDVEVESAELGVSATVAPVEFLERPPADSFDLIFVTSGLVNQLDPMLTSLRPTGTLVMLGSPSADVQFSVFKLNDFSSRTIRGSYIGSPSELAVLLDLARDRQVRVMSTVADFAEAPSALARVRSNSGGFRVVLEREPTFGSSSSLDRF